MSDSTCKHSDGCPRPPRSRGWCNMHLLRIYKNGDPGPVDRIDGKGRTCDHPGGCERKHYSHGWCLMHLKRVQKYGDPGPVSRLIAEPRSCPHGQKQTTCERCRGRWNRDYAYKRKYGISLGDYEQMLANQGGSCANPACGDTEDLHVHHDHDMEEQFGIVVVLGILCRQCNIAAGLQKESPDRLRGLADFIESKAQLRLVNE